MRFLKMAAAVAGTAALLAGTSAMAQTNLRIQTHYAPETVSGKLAAQYIDDIQTMSNGEITVEMFYSSSVVKSVETSDAAASGILDCDMTGSGYMTAKTLHSSSWLTSWAVMKPPISSCHGCISVVALMLLSRFTISLVWS